MEVKRSDIFDYIMGIIGKGVFELWICESYLGFGLFFMEEYFFNC